MKALIEKQTSVNEQIDMLQTESYALQREILAAIADFDKEQLFEIYASLEDSLLKYRVFKMINSL